MAKKLAQHTYSVGILVKAWTDVDIKAPSLEEAMAKAKLMKFDAIVGKNFPLCNDYNWKVIGSYDPDFDITV
jgi:hypothetical protein